MSCHSKCGATGCILPSIRTPTGHCGLVPALLADMTPGMHRPDGRTCLSLNGLLGATSQRGVCAGVQFALNSSKNGAVYYGCKGCRLCAQQGRMRVPGLAH